MLSKETEKKIADLIKRYRSTRDEVISICVAEWWARTVGKDERDGRNAIVKAKGCLKIASEDQIGR